MFQFGHSVRTIHTNGTGHPQGPIEFWLGDSRGRWYGDTLVVDVVDFNSIQKTSPGVAPSAMRVATSRRRSAECTASMAGSAGFCSNAAANAITDSGEASAAPEFVGPSQVAGDGRAGGVTEKPGAAREPRARRGR